MFKRFFNIISNLFKKKQSGVKVYQILKGNFIPEKLYYTGKKHESDTLKFRFKINTGIPYQLPSNQSQIFKIFGLTDGKLIGNDRKENWIGGSNDGKSNIVEVFHYVRNGKANLKMGGRDIWYKKIGECVPKKWHECELSFTHNEMKGYLEDQGINGFERITQESKHFYLEPYGGGSVKTTTDIDLEIEIL